MCIGSLSTLRMTRLVTYMVYYLLDAETKVFSRLGQDIVWCPIIENTVLLIGLKVRWALHKHWHIILLINVIWEQNMQLQPLYFKCCYSIVFIQRMLKINISL